MNEPETFINSVLDTLHSIIYIYDIELQRVVYTNQQVERELGYSFNELQTLGNKFNSVFFYVEDIPKITHQIQEVLTHQNTNFLKTDYRLRYKNGVVKWFECQITVYAFNQHNTPSQLLVCANEISDRKKIETADGNALYITESQLTDNQLHEAKKMAEENEKKHRFLFENTIQGVVYQNTDGHIFYANNAAQNILGLNLDQMQGKASVDPHWRSIHEDFSDFEGETHPAMVSLKTGKPVSNVIMGVFNPIINDYKWIKINSIPQFRDNETSPYQVVVIFEDITAIRKATQELIKAKEIAENNSANTQAIIENTTDSVWAINNQYELIYINRVFKDEFYQSFGIELTTSSNLLNSLPEPLRETWKQRYDRVLNNEQFTFEDKIEVAPNMFIYIEVSMNPIVANGKVIGASFFGRNITGRKNQEQELINAKEKAEESEYKVRSMFENTHTGILFFNAEGYILEANPAVLRIIGSPSLEVTKQINLLTFKPLMDVGFSQNIAKCIAERNVVSSDAVYTSKWGRKVYMKYFLIPIISQNKVTGVWANLQDLTDLWETQEELIYAKEKAEEGERLKSAFLKNISHEVRTPMNAIAGFSELLSRQNITIEERSQFNKIVNKSINQLLSVIENTITIAHIETNQLKINTMEFNPYKLVVELFDNYKRLQPAIEKSHIEFKINTALQSNVTIESDFTHITQILSILLDNAFKFTKKGKIELGYVLSESQIQFIVSDTGIGIPKDKQDIIFKSFAQADDTVRIAFGGVGLGLSIAAGLIKLLGGEMIINSELNSGTEIIVCLPLEHKKGAQYLDVSTKPINFKNITLLVVEDEEFNFLYIEELLAETGINIIHALNGLQALEAFRNQSIDIILMDLKMPVMGGFESTKEIRKTNKVIPIIAQTAFSYKREDCANAGFTDYIAKPFNQDELIKILQLYIDY